MAAQQAERRVGAAELRSFCAALVAAPARMSVAASTSARPPARVRVSLAACLGAGDAAAAADAGVLLEVAVRELDYADGGLGFRLFPSALWLAAWLAARPSLLRGASVLELGAGLGLVGLAAAATHLPSSVTLSDFNPGLLTALRAAAAENGVADTTRVAMCDWAEEAQAAEPHAPPHATHAGQPADGASAWAFAADANPEFYRVRAQLAATSAASDSGSASATAPLFAKLPIQERYSLIVATEVLYEMHAAVALPALLRRRLAPGGRFVTLMAIRDTDLLKEFVARLQSGGALRVALRGLGDVALPPADAPAAAEAAAAAQGIAADAPLCGGAWCDGDAEWRALLLRGGAGGKPLEAAWIEAQRPPTALDADADADSAANAAHAAAKPCCSRSARGMACPCARLPARAARPTP
jgi:predicted nicotinamide N-methyase